MTQPAPQSWLRIWLTSVCSVVAYGKFSAANPLCRREGAVYPPIAHICGVTVGRNTMASLACRFGRGEPSIGGHAVGALSWDLKELGLDIYADGWNCGNYGAGGLIIDHFSLSIDDNVKNPRIGAGEVRQLGLLGLILPGMTQTEVLRQLRDSLPKPKVVQDHFWTGPGRVALGWRMVGRAVQDDQGKIMCSEWNAELDFERGVLVEIDVQSDLQNRNPILAPNSR